MFSRLAAQFLKPTLALLAALAVGGAWAADPAWLVWDAGGGDDSYFTTAANWSNDAAPSADTNASREFASASMGKTVTFNTADESVGAIYVRNLWNKTDTLTPVVFEAKDSNQSYGFVVARAFSAADMANSQSAFTIKSGTYKANGWSLWAYGANSSLDAKIKGGTVSLNAGIGIAEGVGGNVTSRVDVCGGTLAIEGGDMLIGLNSDADSLAEISVSNGGVISCGENVEKWIALGHGGSYAGTVNFNIDAGGTLKAWRIEKRSSTTTTKAKINFNGGTLAALGEEEIIGAGIDVVIGANGGTIDVGANVVTNAAPVSGTGTITVKGTGSLTFTGDMSGFCGAVVVETSGCTVTLPASATKAVPGVNTSASNGVYSYSADTTHHDWWTGDSSTDWATAGNWGRFLIDEGTTGYDINEWNDNTINFASVVNISKPLTITENDPNNSYNVEFTASSASDGLVSTDVLNVGTSNEGTATFTSGTYSFNNMYVGGSGATGSVTVNGASLTITTGDPQIGNGGTGTFTLSSGFVSFGYAGSAKWAFLKGGTINLDGGEMAVCRLNCDTAPAVINFNGGTLTSYNDGYSKDNIIENDANWTLNVKAGGAKFNIPSGLTTTVNQVLAGDAESTGGGLTKLGPGTLILAVAPTFNGGITLHEGSIVIPDTYAENDVMTDVEGYDVSVATGSGVKTYTLTKKTYTDADIAAATQIISSKSVTVDVANEAQFIGMVDTCGLTKNGTGTLTLFGQNTIVGPVVVNSGILKLAAVPTDLSNVEFDLDALEVSTLLDSDNNASDTSIVKWKDLSDNCYDATITDESGATLENSGSYFGENKVVKADVVRMTRPGGSNRTTTFLVFRNADNYKSNWDILVGAWASGQSDYGKVHGRYYSNVNSASYNEQSNTGSVTVRANITGSTSSQSVEPQVVSIRGNVTKDASYVEFGFAGNTRYWAEVLRLSEELTDSQTQVIEKYLMHKWVVNNTSWSVDYSAAEISVAGGATLDIGSGTWTVSSLGVSGTGIATVQNGELTITSPISLSDGQILKIPAGSTYTLAEGVRSTTADGVTTLSTAAAHVGSTPFQTVQAAIDELVAGTAEGSLTIHESASVNLSTTAASITDVVLDDGVTLTFTANPPWQASYDSESGTIVNQRVPSTFVWNPQNNSTDWETLANWKIADAPASELPGEKDTVQFRSSEESDFKGWTVTLAGNISVMNISVAASTRVDLKSSSAPTVRNVELKSYTCESTSTLGLSYIKILPKDCDEEYALAIGGIVDIVDGTTNYILSTSSRHVVEGKVSKKPQGLVLSADLTGSGYLHLGSNANQTRSGTTLSGNNAGFEGTVQIDGPGKAMSLVWQTASSGSASARWIVNQFDDRSLSFGFLNDTICFGSLEGTGTITLAANSSPSVQIGDGGDDSSCGFNFARGSSSKSANLVKTGSNKLSFAGRIANGNGNGSITIENGILDLAGKDSLPNSGQPITMTGGIIAVTGTYPVYDTTDNGDGTVTTNSTTYLYIDPSPYFMNQTTYPICFSNGVNEVHKWETALAVTNTKGLKKLGAGTLKLSYAPAYSGFEITVAENGGSVVLPKNANITLGDCTVVSAETETTKTLSYAATVNITGLTHEHATATVTAGGESVPVTDGTAAVPVGSNVVITWTAASGYQITANGMQNIENIREAVTATAPTVKKGIGLIFLAF